jgi:hypothetical protein
VTTSVQAGGEYPGFHWVSVTGDVDGNVITTVDLGQGADVTQDPQFVELEAFQR